MGGCGICERRQRNSFSQFSSAVFKENWENEVKLNEQKRQKVKMSNTGQQVQQIYIYIYIYILTCSMCKSDNPK